MKVEKVYPAGWKVIDEENEQTVYFGEYGKFGELGNEGVVYKDEEAFKTGKGICYICEYGFENEVENGSTLFEMSAKQATASDIVNNPYYSFTGYTRQDIEECCVGHSFSAQDIFETLDWQSVETLVEEWAEDEEENE